MTQMKFAILVSLITWLLHTPNISENHLNKYSGVWNKRNRTFINFSGFSHPYCSYSGPYVYWNWKKIIFSEKTVVILSLGHFNEISWFWNKFYEEIFPPVLLLWTVCLMIDQNVPTHMSIPDRTFIQDSRVRIKPFC